jgi:predicted enzyme related to lactoylglutathione lyase
MGATYVFAGIAVADLEPALAWYERFVGRPPDLVPHAHEAAWRFTDDGWIYVVADAERAGNGLVTVLVDDLDARLSGLGLRGISVGAITTIADGVRTVAVHDPEGNRITLAQPPPGA